MLRHDLHRAAYFEETVGLQRLHQLAALVGLQFARRRREAHRECVDALADRIRAGRIERFRDGFAVRAAELVQHALEAAEQRDVGIQAQRGHVAAGRILDADRRAFRGAAVGEAVRVVREHGREIVVRDAGEAELGRGIADCAPRQVVVDREDRVLRRAQVVNHDLGERREHRAEPFGDALHLFDQRCLFGQREFTGGGHDGFAVRFRIDATAWGNGRQACYSPPAASGRVMSASSGCAIRT